ncbi:right-handed parallel beta-helix repeat-containing protein [Pelagicoccus sp. NFK12]|uniref:Right-handed parallel beta-helix repeat-containing protein n=1 Tax=Pelagicoccus enzymogenes TaxID=2773457 RepID=A0A927F640_9BACT|nr:right-handed parallel beta-helix repeat-containing protein [Pelagicoccus enzymogenes]MBD5778897.1 right-handed parallel beta-helix repeat-containing protein [Pelagicoccus enzymogenes]
MKNVPPRSSFRFVGGFCALSAIALFLTGCGQPSVPEVTVFPAPGDLSEVEGLEESALFDVSVNGEDTFVYRGFQKEFNKYGFAKKGGHYVNFSFANTAVTVDVTTSKPFSSFSVKPTQALVERVSDTQLRFTLQDPSKFLVTAEFEESGENWLVVAADGPEQEVPSKDDPSVLYLEAGVHKFGRSWDPFVDGIKTVYMEPGTVVEATLKVVGKEGLTIKGRGLFAQGFRPHAKVEDPLQTEWLGDCMGAYFRECKDLRFEGYAVINCPSYQLEVADCDRVSVENLKLLGFGWNNNDGMHLYSRDVTVENSFIAGNDDRICVTGLFDSEDREIKTVADQKARIKGCDVGNLVIRNNVFWGQRNGGDIMLTWNGSHTCEDVLIEGCKSIGFTNKGFLSAMHGGSVVIKDVTVRDIEIYHHRLTSVLVRDAKTWGDGGGAIDGLTLENIQIHAEPKEVSLLLTGWSEESPIRNVTLRNITANGQKITSFDQTSIETNEFVKNVVWE